MLVAERVPFADVTVRMFYGLQMQVQFIIYALQSVFIAVSVKSDIAAASPVVFGRIENITSLMTWAINPC